MGSITRYWMHQRINRDDRKTVKFIDSTEEIMRNLNRNTTSRRARLKLSGQQIDTLESNFKVESHPSHLTKNFLSKNLSIPLKNVQIWFQNRRAKEKMARGEPTSEEIGDGGSYDHNNIGYQAMCPFDFSSQERYFL